MQYRNKKITIAYRAYGIERGFRVMIDGQLVKEEGKVWIGKTKNAAECKALCAVDRMERKD